MATWKKKSPTFHTPKVEVEHRAPGKKFRSSDKMLGKVVWSLQPPVTRVPKAEVLKDLPGIGSDGHHPIGKRPRFTGELQRPIVQPLSQLTEGEQDAVLASILSQRIDKLVLLLKHYEIENTSDPWLFLSLRLASKFVRGFSVVSKPPRGRGRPPKWKGQAADEVIQAVEAVQNQRSGRTIANAIDILKKHDPIRWEKLTEARYYEALKDRKLRAQAARAFTIKRPPENAD
jgi:hypothetical protein